MGNNHIFSSKLLPKIIFNKVRLEFSGLTCFLKFFFSLFIIRFFCIILRTTVYCAKIVRCEFGKERLIKACLSQVHYLYV